VLDARATPGRISPIPRHLLVGEQALHNHGRLGFADRCQCIDGTGPHGRIVVRCRRDHCVEPLGQGEEAQREDVVGPLLGCGRWYARGLGSGQRYLIQHSAGSGKSFTIAWLAHQLSTLHDASDRRVFESIVVITDRRVLDRQLQTTMRQFEQTLGVVENIDTTSRQLKEALELGKTIIVTTLQKFPVIAKEIGELPGKRFAVIVDEAQASPPVRRLKCSPVLPAHSQRRGPTPGAVLGSPMVRLETRRCQINSTTTAPTVAPISPAP
jgi:hypothetical protein